MSTASAPAKGAGDLSSQPQNPTAVLSACASYFLWGLTTLMFIVIGRAGGFAAETIAWRLVWTPVLAMAVVLLTGRGPELAKALTDRRLVLGLAAAAVAISASWALFIWAVTNNYKLETSLGYFISPLMSLVIGAVFLRERITRLAGIAVALAAIGVGVQTAALGHAPVVALGLALTFVSYSVIRKHLAVGAQTGMAIEGLVMAPFGLVWSGWLAMHGQSHFGHDLRITLLLLALAPATLLPFTLFAWSARRISMSLLGFLQFITPTRRIG